MAQSTVELSAPKLMQGITIKVRFARLAGLRIRLAALVMRLAGIIAGCAIDISTGFDDAIEYGDDGLPRALSMVQGHRGFHKDAALVGSGLVIKLDGETQDRLVAFDVDAGRIARYAEDAAGGLTLLIEHRKGVVTVERKQA